MSWKNNPCLEIKLGIKHNPRARHLSPTEIYLFWHQLDKAHASEIMKLALKFMLCTVVRGKEIRQFKWKDYDRNEGVWTLPTTKNGTFHRVHLGKLAIDVFNDAKKISKHRHFVFDSMNKKSHQSIGLTDGAMAKAIKRSREVFDISEPFTPHDLRRTSATLIATMFADRDYVKRALNHVEKDATTVYDQYIYDREKRISANVLDYVLRRIIESKNIESVPTLCVLREEVEANGLLHGRTPLKEENKGEIISVLPISNGVTYSLNFDPLKNTA